MTGRYRFAVVSRATIDYLPSCRKSAALLMATRSKLAVILHADVVGSTALVQKDERVAHERIQNSFQRLSETITAYGGVTHEVRGDALVAVMGRASDGVSATLAFQVANTEQNAVLADDIRPEIRVGIALGEVVVADNTVTGPGVVLAQRIEQLAEPRGLCISAAIHEAVPRRLPVEIKSLGDQSVKGFDEPVRVYSVCLRAGEKVPEPADDVYSDDSEVKPSTPVLALPDKPSIAVLPFTNLSGDQEQEYFSDGITEDIITELSRFRTLFVIDRNSSFAFKDQAMDVKEIAQKLGVRYVVEGSVRKAADHIRITVQLIDATAGSHLWVERYDRLLKDIFAVQDEISQSIAAAIEPELGAIEGQRSRARAPEILDAWDCYHQGLWHLYKFTVEGLAQAEALFERAVGLDPEFAPAYARLAYVHIQKYWYEPHESREESVRQALAAAKRAVELDERDAVGHFSLGRAYVLQGQYELGIAEMETAIELNPSFAQAYLGLGHALNHADRPEEALPQFDNAIRLGLHDPHRWTFFHLQALAYYKLGKLKDAELCARTSVRLPNVTYWAFATLTSILGSTNKHDEAVPIIQELLRRKPGYSCSYATDDLLAGRDLQSVPLVEHYVAGLRKAGLPE